MIVQETADAHCINCFHSTCSGIFTRYVEENHIRETLTWETALPDALIDQVASEYAQVTH